jgi:hypothetical protein
LETLDLETDKIYQALDFEKMEMVFDYEYKEK